MGTPFTLLFACVPCVKTSVQDRADRYGHTRVYSRVAALVKVLRVRSRDLRATHRAGEREEHAGQTVGSAVWNFARPRLSAFVVELLERGVRSAAAGHNLLSPVQVRHPPAHGSQFRGGASGDVLHVGDLVGQFDRLRLLERFGAWSIVRAACERPYRATCRRSSPRPASRRFVRTVPRVTLSRGRRSPRWYRR